MSRKTPRGMRQQVAAEAARIIAEQGYTDFDGARRKAVDHLHVTDRRQWPDNAEIARELDIYQSIFQRDTRNQALDRLRRAALAAMELLSDFSPRMVGSVRDGTAGVHSPVVLHLTADSAKTVAIMLLDHRVPHVTDEHRLRFSNGNVGPRPVLRFSYRGVEVHAVVLAPEDRGSPPLDPVSGRPERGVDAEGLRGLLVDQERSASGT